MESFVRVPLCGRKRLAAVAQTLVGIFDFIVFLGIVVPLGEDLG